MDKIASLPEVRKLGQKKADSTVRFETSHRLAMWCNWRPKIASSLQCNGYEKALGDSRDLKDLSGTIEKRKITPHEVPFNGALSRLKDERFRPPALYPLSMNSERQSKFELDGELVVLLTDAQPRLMGFLLKRLGNSDQAHEVLQEVNLVLCRRAAEYQPGTNFMAWAFTIARFQIMAFRKRQTRDLLVFPEDLANTLEAMDQQMFQPELQRSRETALRDCMGKLREEHQGLLLQRYAESLSVKAIAADFGKSVNAISLLLHRIREQLLGCIEKNLSGEIRS